MNLLLQIFSTREVAIIIWGLILLVVLMFVKSMRKILGGFLKIAGHKFVLVFISLSATYITLPILLLWKLGLWDVALLKDTCFWFMFTFIGIAFSVNKAQDFTFFSNVIKNNIQAILPFEFIVNFYTFSLPVELISVPIISFIAIIQGVLEARQDKDLDSRHVASCLGRFLSIFGWAVLLFTLYKTVVDYSTFFTASNVKALLLPIFLLILSLPFYYGLALFLQYESFFVTLKCKKEYEIPAISRKLKAATLLYANINIIRLNRVRKHLFYLNSEKDDIYQFIKKSANKQKYIIDSKAKFPIFNDVKRALTTLSKNGLGEMSEWVGREDYYSSSSPLYDFQTSNKGITDNHLNYLLSGEENCIHDLYIELNIGAEQGRTQALLIFKEVVAKTFESLGVSFSHKLSRSIEQFKKYSADFDDYSIVLECVEFHKVAWSTLSISTRFFECAST